MNNECTNWREDFFITLTTSRLILTVGLVNAIDTGSWDATIWLAAVIVADIPNGILARRFKADTPTRRIADSVVDRITISGACTALAVQRPEVALALIPLAIRGAVLIIGSGACWALKNSIVTSKQLHKLGSLTTGAMGFVLLSGSRYWPLAVAIATVLSVALLPAYILPWCRVLRAPRAAILTRYYTVY